MCSFLKFPLALRFLSSKQKSQQNRRKCFRRFPQRRFSGADAQEAWPQKASDVNHSVGWWLGANKWHPSWVAGTRGLSSPKITRSQWGLADENLGAFVLCFPKGRNGEDWESVGRYYSSSQFSPPEIIFLWSTNWSEQVSQASSCNQGSVSRKVSSLKVPSKHVQNNRFFFHLTKSRGLPPSHFMRIHLPEDHVDSVTDFELYMGKNGK